MGLTRVAIERPIFLLMVISAVTILGLVAFSRLTAELFPSLNSPVVTITTIYPGASPEDVERLISKPIEDAVAGIPGVDFVTSSSSESHSLVIVTFNESANLDVAAIDVERRVSAIRATLPTDADASTVVKTDPSQIPVLYLAMSAGSAQAVPLAELFRLAEERIKPRLEGQPGVAKVEIIGGREREIQVRFNPTRLRAYDLELGELSQALARENQGIPSGPLERGRQHENVRLYGLVQSPAELSDITVASRSNGVIRLGDVAEIADSYKRIVGRTFLNGREGLSLTVTKQSGTNEVQVVDAVRAEIERLNRTLPNGTSITVMVDLSNITRSSLAGIEQTLLEAILLTGLVLLVFLHSWRSTLIVMLAIPTSLIGTFLAMKIFDFTLNMVSSMALVLVIGVLVDDSIVVLENIHRHLEQGEAPRIAALKGRNDIGMAAIAITLVDVVIFLPIALTSGLAGQWLRQFGLVIVTATLISLFISFTLTPMLAARWLSSRSETPAPGIWGAFVRWYDTGFLRLSSAYASLLHASLRQRFVPALIGLLSVMVAIGLVRFGLVRFEFIPAIDDSFFHLSIELPPGSSLDLTEDALRRVEQRIATLPEIDRYMTTSGVGGERFGEMIVVLVGRDHRQRALLTVADQAIDQANELLAREFPGAVARKGLGSAVGRQPVQVRVMGEDPAVLDGLASQVEGILSGIPGSRDVSNNASSGTPELRLVPDRRRLADAGLSTQQVGQALRTALDGVVATTLRPSGQDEVDVRLIANAETRTDLRDLTQLPLLGQRNGQPVLVNLGQVTRTETVEGPTSIDHRDRQRVVIVSANLTSGTKLNDVTDPLRRQLRDLQARGAIPADYSVQLGGAAEDQATAFDNVFLALWLSIVLEYMLMAALYESLLQPFARMFALPVAIFGAISALAVSGNTLNMLSLIGIVVLLALVGKNGILLIDYTNALRRQGLSREAALLTAGPARLRPILMTSAAIIFGMLPLALRRHDGYELYVSLATVIIGGMLSSTFLSLLVVPCMYTYFDDLEKLVGKFWRWRPRRRPTPQATSAGALPARAPRARGSPQWLPRRSGSDGGVR